MDFLATERDHEGTYVCGPVSLLPWTQTHSLNQPNLQFFVYLTENQVLSRNSGTKYPYTNGIPSQKRLLSKWLS